ncbi:MAG: hypothetical protein AB1673_07475 [Actinomycetota bacterium]
MVAGVVLVPGLQQPGRGPLRAVATLASERSKAEYAVALREPLVVAAWAEVLHAETAAARLTRP